MTLLGKGPHSIWVEHPCFQGGLPLLLATKLPIHVVEQHLVGANAHLDGLALVFQAPKRMFVRPLPHALAQVA